MFTQDLILELTMTIASSNVEKRLRRKLRGELACEYSKNKNDLFMNLFKTWCYNPVAALILCLLSKNYQLAYNLIKRFPQQVEIDFATLK